MNPAAHRAYVGIGSNLDDRVALCREAVAHISRLPNTGVLQQSSLYETEPVGDAEPWFIKAVVAVEVRGSARQFLQQLLAIEAHTVS